MATNHTANYQLNLWEAQDKFLREEINENFSKTDTALAKKAENTALAALSQTVSGLIDPVLLTEFTLTESAAVISVPITDEYRQKYRKLLVYHDLKAGKERSADVKVRCVNGELAPFRTSIYPRKATVTSNQAAFSQLTLELTAPVVLFHNYSYRIIRGSSSDDSDRFDNRCAIPDLIWSQVSQLEFTSWSNDCFLAGSRVQMFGLL